jgi:FkbH-like protein
VVDTVHRSGEPGVIVDAALAPEPADKVRVCLDKAERQHLLFATSPSYTELISVEGRWPVERIAVSVHRNQSFELVERLLRPFLAFGGRRADVAYSPYDDSLPMGTDGSAELELVWVDFSRYARSGEQLADWFIERIATLRSRSSAPILVCDWASETAGAIGFNARLQTAVAALAGVYVCEQSSIARSLGAPYGDSRSTAVAGTPLSRQATVLTAQSMGLRWIPAALGMRVKAVVVDLDNTLYSGVLSEDGLDGIVVTDEHRALQRDLIELSRLGMYLAVASRNDPQDVAQLLDGKGPLELHAADLAASIATWDDKTVGVIALAEKLHIHPDSMLFIDDNPGELAQIASETSVSCLHATDPTSTRRGLGLYPGLFRFHLGDEDSVRVHDIQASSVRAAELATATDPAAYRLALGARLRFRMNPRDLVDRLHELSAKTNQFNTALRRFTAADVAEYIEADDRRVVSVGLADRLSDSGVVAAFFARRHASVLHIDEISISCRALGRQLEQTMIVESVRRILVELPSAAVRVDWHRGTRNGPALDWLGASSSPLVGDEGSALIDTQSEAADGVVIEWDGDATHD